MNKHPRSQRKILPLRYSNIPCIATGRQVTYRQHPMVLLRCRPARLQLDSPPTLIVYIAHAFGIRLRGTTLNDTICPAALQYSAFKQAEDIRSALFSTDALTIPLVAIPEFLNVGRVGFPSLYSVVTVMSTAL